MFDRLSEKQKLILNYDAGCVVAKACPGSGKTFSVAARIAKLIKEKNFTTRGIAAISFTNVAGEEIASKLSSDFKLPGCMTYPHFLGTIDKFINTYIFLPFGHLIMGCDKRPDLVGAPHKSWTKGKGDKKYFYNKKTKSNVVGYANPHSYFDSTSFNIREELYPLTAATHFHFSFSNYYTKKGAVHKTIADIIDAKRENFKLGFANQADANYLAWKILVQYPLIAQTIASKFEYFIVDEAQDTDEIQMRIIDILMAAGASNVMLVGDRDQSIFEWNNADPAFFDQKFNELNRITLDENWRSSQLICDFTRSLSTFERPIAANPSVSKYPVSPLIRGYDPNTSESMYTILGEYFGSCEVNGIKATPESIAVLYRGKKMVEYLGLPFVKIDFSNSPWSAHNYHVKDIVIGKALIEAGAYKRGYALLEKGFLEAFAKMQDPLFHCSNRDVEALIEKHGFYAFRMKISQFIDLLPSTKGTLLSDWINSANNNLEADGRYRFRLNVDMNKSRLTIDSLLAEIIDSKHEGNYYHGTIHSVKGRTFDAVLLMLGKKAGSASNYSTMLAKGAKPKEEEELRNVYVGITRPRKILMLAVPNDDVATWSAKLR